MIFFFKQKTAYEMRISDWSADVCSYDLSMQFTSQARLGWRRFPGSPQLLLQPSPPPLTAFGGGQEAKQCNSLFAGDDQSLAVWRGDSKRAEHFQSIFHIPVPVCTLAEPVMISAPVKVLRAF